MDLIFKRFPRNYRSIDRKVYDIKFKYAVKHSDLTIAISQQTKQDIIDFYKIKPEKIKVGKFALLFISRVSSTIFVFAKS